jgi:transcriptional regulator with XRE-family HTH domain
MKDGDFLEFLCLFLKEYRKSKEMSQEELAELANLDRTYISGFERGVRNISINSLQKIIDGLGLHWKELVRLMYEENNHKKK